MPCSREWNSCATDVHFATTKKGLSANNIRKRFIHVEYYENRKNWVLSHFHGVVEKGMLYESDYVQSLVVNLYVWLAEWLPHQEVNESLTMFSLLLYLLVLCHKSSVNANVETDDFPLSSCQFFPPFKLFTSRYFIVYHVRESRLEQIQSHNHRLMVRYPILWSSFLSFVHVQSGNSHLLQFLVLVMRWPTIINYRLLFCFFSPK